EPRYLGCYGFPGRQHPCLVGQTDRRKRTAHALWRMNQRRGNWSDDNAPGLSDVLENPAFQFGSDRQANALLCGSIINNALVAGSAFCVSDSLLADSASAAFCSAFVASAFRFAFGKAPAPESTRWCSAPPRRVSAFSTNTPSTNS